MYDPEGLRKEMPGVLDITDDFRSWARQKRKRPIITSADPRLTKGISKKFLPKYCSTPVRSEKKRTSLFTRPEIVDKGEVQCVVSLSNGFAQESNENSLKSINNLFDRTFTNENKANEPVYTDTPKKSESQFHGMPATKHNVVNNPVQAQVKQENTQQLAEPHILKIISQRIQPRPPIHGQSHQFGTPSNYVPTVTSNGTPTVTTQILPKQKIIPTTTTLTLLEGIGLTSSSAQNTEAGRTIILRTPTSQSNQFGPAPHITINVNVGNSVPQTPLQIQTICTYDQNIESTTNGGDQRSNKNESLITNDSDSNGNEANVCDIGCKTTGYDYSNVSAHRGSFSIDEAKQTGHTATFNEVDKLTQTIVNVTQTIQGDSTHLSDHENQFRARSNNNMTNANMKGAKDKEKRKKKSQPTGKVNAMKKPSRSESKAKRSKATEDPEYRLPKNVLPSTVGLRRSGRDRKQNLKNIEILRLINIFNAKS